MYYQTPNALLTIILAAGKGTRMKTSCPKVLHTLGGRPLLDHVLDTAVSIGPEKILVVTGHGSDAVRSLIEHRSGNLEIVIQEPQLGTGHAVAQCLDILSGFEGTVIVLSGDVPGLRAESVQALVRAKVNKKAALSVLTGHLEDPTGYGRILRGSDGQIREIREQKDLSEGQSSITEVNLGVYAFDSTFLARELPDIGRENAQGEYYLTDLIEAAVSKGSRVVSHSIEDHTEALGINTLRELSGVEKMTNRRYLEKLMDSGVQIIDPDQTWIEDSVVVAPDVVIHPTVFLRGKTKIGAGCVINPGSVITDSTLGERVEIRPYCVINDSTIADDAAVGPFAHLRPGTDIRGSAKIGNFVETKKAVIGEGSKVSHLTYVGDAELGKGVNIGAGCVTCNYDGFNKYRTVIEDEVFVGSGTMMVAPVTLGKGSLVAAGSTLSKDVPPGALAIARSQQVAREGWASARREKLSAKDKKEKS
jgi:bifunctional UDP-N-acetylglucosamine pyrophosphorylase/glucosamine-1-phosphate N-acetyltransferase